MTMASHRFGSLGGRSLIDYDVPVRTLAGQGGEDVVRHGRRSP